MNLTHLLPMETCGSKSRLGMLERNQSQIVLHSARQQRKDKQMAFGVRLRSPYEYHLSVLRKCFQQGRNTKTCTRALLAHDDSWVEWAQGVQSLLPHCQPLLWVHLIYVYLNDSQYGSNRRVPIKERIPISRAGLLTQNFDKMAVTLNVNASHWSPGH